MDPTRPIANGRGRPTLADQLDRLDQILDGLAEALNAAVSQAVKDAVHTAVAELGRRPGVVVPGGPEPATVGPTWRHRLGRAASRVGAVVTQAVRYGLSRATAEPQRRRAATVANAAWRAMTRVTVRAAAGSASRIRAAWRRCCKTPVAAAVAVGLAGGVVAPSAGGLVVAAVCGVTSAAFTWGRLAGRKRKMTPRRTGPEPPAATAYFTASGG